MNRWCGMTKLTHLRESIHHYEASVTNTTVARANTHEILTELRPSQRKRLDTVERSLEEEIAVHKRILHEAEIV